MCSSNASRCIVSPQHLARTLEWNKKRGGILALDIAKSRIAVAVTKHPLINCNSIRKLDPIPYCHHRDESNVSIEFRDERKDEIYNELQRLVTLEKICGFLVGWPLEPSGLPGSRGGQVMHLMDYLSERRNDGNQLINRSSRPIALWDQRPFTHGKYHEHKYPTDEWGRSLLFAKEKIKLPKYLDKKDAPKNYYYKTSLRSDHNTSDDSTVASLILEQFLDRHSHIFGMSIGQEDKSYRSSSGNEYKNMIEHIEKNGSYLTSSAL